MTKTGTNPTPWPAHRTPPYQLLPAHSSAARPRNWAGPASLAAALLAWVAAALHIGLLVAGHEMTIGAADSRCLVDAGLVNAALLSLVAGFLLSIGAVVTGFAGVSGPRRGRGVYRALAIAGLAIGVLFLLGCGFELSHSISPHAVSPAYLHPC
jgi:hypothetical protein